MTIGASPVTERAFVSHTGATGFPAQIPVMRRRKDTSTLTPKQRVFVPLTSADNLSCCFLSSRPVFH